jgi:PleD family two-component response regulator
VSLQFLIQVALFAGSWCAHIKVPIFHRSTLCRITGKTFMELQYDLSSHQYRGISGMAKKILIVEDSPTQAQKTRFLLEGKGYQVELANDGAEGIHRAADFQPDLIVLDVYLPDLNGFEVCKLLKSSNELRTTPVIMFSNDNKLRNMVNAYEMGADYYVVKSDEGERVLTLLIETVFTRMSRSTMHSK